MFTLQNKTALVTGASRGIGRSNGSGTSQGRGTRPGSLWPLFNPVRNQPRNRPVFLDSVELHMCRNMLISSGWRHDEDRAIAGVNYARLPGLAAPGGQEGRREHGGVGAQAV